MNKNDLINEPLVPSKGNASVDQHGGIAIPAILWFMGVPVTLLLVLWLVGMF